ncbi:hypothetical protein CEY12_21165 [Chryseobacterium sp. T16E-39]|uniref:DUF4304 domain-containing protein n=1 Tax=Chryseobacterium sp. T16E-39 TaxID=2015076 RepID=UPI000B5B3145|nr:DUF4304 domain-containing protein [Chryseobacterium sp. T16E-39]ASK32439.1 hypothetical protein CEY12_21165 [Chryseobacterium sp. T16E-39]
MNTKTIFLKTCNEISDKLETFKTFEKGQRIRKISIDKDLYCEVYFQSSSKNTSSYIQILPHIAIFSKELKKWQIEHTNNENVQGLIFGEQIGYLTPHKNWQEWNLADLSFEKSIHEITDQIKQYILPIFNLFSTKEKAIEFLKINGTKFNPYSEYSLLPLDFLLCFAEKETAQKFFNDFMNTCSYKSKIINLYQQLETKEEIDLNYSEFTGANKVKLAFINGLKIIGN